MLILLFCLANLLPSMTEGEQIYWGKEAKPHSHPYMAIVVSHKNNKISFRCGGFLIQDDIVMTAAHCYRSKMSVYLGVHNIREMETTQQIIPVITYRIHKDFDEYSLVNDIMLLKLQYKAQLNYAVSTIAIPRRPDRLLPGQVCNVAGWGKMGNGTYSVTLREVNLEMQLGQDCTKRFPNFYNDSIELCAGNPKEKKATGSGDSGGPLVCNNVAQGIVSYGKCCPEVYTRISSFLPWIHNTMKLFSWG